MGVPDRSRNALVRSRSRGRVWPTATITKVVGGVTPECTKLAAALYSQVTNSVFEVSSPRVAETAKLLENTFRSVNIALANELAFACRKIGIDPWEVIDAAATKPFGFMPFYPGPGIGGHCRRATRTTCPGGRASPATRPSSSRWPTRSTGPCPSTWYPSWATS